MNSYFHSQTFPPSVFQYGCSNTHRRNCHHRNSERPKNICRILCCRNGETSGDGKRKTLSSAWEKPRNTFRVNFMNTSMNVGNGTSFLQAEGNKVLLLIKASHKEAAMEILKAQIIKLEQLQSLQQEGFMMQNLIPVYIGKDSNTEIDLTKEVYVTVDSASSATLNEIDRLFE